MDGKTLADLPSVSFETEEIFGALFESEKRSKLGPSDENLTLCLNNDSSLTGHETSESRFKLWSAIESLRRANPTMSMFEPMMPDANGRSYAARYVRAVNSYVQNMSGKIPANFDLMEFIGNAIGGGRVRSAPRYRRYETAEPSGQG